MDGIIGMEGNGPVGGTPRAMKILLFSADPVALDAVIIKEKCIKCGVCVRMCPVEPKAVDWQDDHQKSKPPVYKYDRCIRCYCCQEVCPEGVSN